MDHFEMVEKLRQKANVSYEEAKSALESSDWDLLDALVMLENQGKINQAQPQADSYTTRKEETTPPPVEHDMKGALSRFFSFVAEAINKANKIIIQVSRHGKEMFTLPLTVLILLLIFMFWWVVPVAVIALFFGFRYRILGASVSDSLNRAMDKAADAAESIKTGSKPPQNS
jgi:hypothetical protein